MLWSAGILFFHLLILVGATEKQQLHLQGSILGTNILTLDSKPEIESNQILNARQGRSIYDDDRWEKVGSGKSLKCENIKRDSNEDSGEDSDEDSDEYSYDDYEFIDALYNLFFYEYSEEDSDEDSDKYSVADLCEAQIQYGYMYSRCKQKNGFDLMECLDDQGFPVYACDLMGEVDFKLCCARVAGKEKSLLAPCKIYSGEQLRTCLKLGPEALKTQSPPVAVQGPANKISKDSEPPVPSTVNLPTRKDVSSESNDTVNPVPVIVSNSEAPGNVSSPTTMTTNGLLKPITSSSEKTTTAIQHPVIVNPPTTKNSNSDSFNIVNPPTTPVIAPNFQHPVVDNSQNVTDPSTLNPPGTSSKDPSTGTPSITGTDSITGTPSPLEDPTTVNQAPNIIHPPYTGTVVSNIINLANNSKVSSSNDVFNQITLHTTMQIPSNINMSQVPINSLPPNVPHFVSVDSASTSSNFTTFNKTDSNQVSQQSSILQIPSNFYPSNTYPSGSNIFNSVDSNQVSSSSSSSNNSLTTQMSQQNSMLPIPSNFYPSNTYSPNTQFPIFNNPFIVPPSGSNILNSVNSNQVSSSNNNFANQVSQQNIMQQLQSNFLPNITNPFSQVPSYWAFPG